MNNAQANIVKANLDRLKHLPKPDGEHRYNAFHPRLQSMFKILRRNGLIHEVGTEALKNGETAALWATDDDTYELTHRLLDGRDRHAPPALPCGDYGFTNDGDQLVCPFDDCDGAWSKAELRYFWTHGGLPEDDRPVARECDACGGTAVRLPSSGEELDDVRMYYYRCEDCPAGGHVEVRDDHTERVGPVFDADRYNTHGATEVSLSD